MKINPSDAELGQVIRAYTAYNYKEKGARLADFDLKRWLKVIRALNGHVKRRGRPRKEKP